LAPCNRQPVTNKVGLGQLM